MPTYEYACRQCGNHLEVVQSFSDEPLTECPSCGGALRKVFGAIGIAFKGSGFYRTDSRSDGRASKAGAGKKETESPASGSSATSGSSSESSGTGTGSTSGGTGGKGEAKSA